MDTDDSGSSQQATASPNNLVKDDKVWLYDGNIVVIAENTAFRVHKSILAQHSDVFRDILSLPSSSPSPDAVDGCEVIHVSDTTEDMRHLLLVLCCGKNYYYDLDEIISVPFFVVASLIRMGHKYDIPGVLNPALARLKKYYPTTLEAWRDAANRARYVASTDPHDAITAVQLARLTDTPSILPSAFLQCCDFIDEIYPETHPQRGTLVLSAGLSPKDHATVISGLIRANSVTGGLRARYLLEIPRLGCVSLARCKQAAKVAAYGEVASVSLSFAAVLRSTEHQTLTFRGVSAAICETCRVDILNMGNPVWSWLPGFFGVSVDDWRP